MSLNSSESSNDVTNSSNDVSSEKDFNDNPYKKRCMKCHDKSKHIKTLKPCTHRVCMTCYKRDKDHCKVCPLCKVIVSNGLTIKKVSNRYDDVIENLNGYNLFKNCVVEKINKYKSNNGIDLYLTGVLV